MNNLTTIQDNCYTKNHSTCYGYQFNAWYRLSTSII